MSTKNLPEDGLLQPVSTIDPPSPKIVSAAAEQKANAVEGAEETSARPEPFDFEGATAHQPWR
jgi:hypothetical protein